MRIPPPSTARSTHSEFEAFTLGDGERLKRVLTARFGTDVGREATADALAYAWHHWDRVRVMANPLGYLYRVAQSSARRYWRWRRPVQLPREETTDVPLPEPGLERALASLSASQRVAVVLVHALGWTYEETAEVMGVPITTVRNHLHRGMKRLRRRLGEQ